MAMATGVNPEEEIDVAVVGIANDHRPIGNYKMIVLSTGRTMWRGNIQYWRSAFVIDNELFVPGSSSNEMDVYRIRAPRGHGLNLRPLFLTERVRTVKVPTIGGTTVHETRVFGRKVYLRSSRELFRLNSDRTKCKLVARSDSDLQDGCAIREVTDAGLTLAFTTNDRDLTYHVDTETFEWGRIHPANTRRLYTLRPGLNSPSVVDGNAERLFFRTTEDCSSFHYLGYRDNVVGNYKYIDPGTTIVRPPRLYNNHLYCIFERNNTSYVCAMDPLTNLQVFKFSAAQLNCSQLLYLVPIIDDAFADASAPANAVDAASDPANAVDAASDPANALTVRTRSYTG